MRTRPERGAVASAAAALVLLTAGCGHLSGLRWPWHHAAPPAPAPVHELDITGAAGADAVPQYWKRNTLLVDLSAAGGSGSITLKPSEGSTWPVRVALRVTPGAIGFLEIRSAQRVSLPISSTAGKPVDLELPPGVYTPQTAEMRISWGPGATPAP